MNVYLSPSAYEQVHEILDYLEANWTSSVSDNFLDKLERAMDIISEMPYSSPVSEKNPNLRKCVISRRVSAWYRVDETKKEVEIIAVLDSRRDVDF
jgi:plasmid stabilization system protein ParE